MLHINWVKLISRVSVSHKPLKSLPRYWKFLAMLGRMLTLLMGRALVFLLQTELEFSTLLYAEA